MSRSSAIVHGIDISHIVYHVAGIHQWVCGWDKNQRGRGGADLENQGASRPSRLKLTVRSTIGRASSGFSSAGNKTS